MATTMQPTAENHQTADQLPDQRRRRMIEMNDPPANTYTYEMNRQLDDAILQARMDNDVHSSSSPA